MRFPLALFLTMISLSSWAFDISSLYHESYTGKPNLDTSLLTDGKLHIYLCGTGVPQVTMQAVRHPSCLAVIGDGQFMMFDAGDGSVQTLGEMSLPFHQIQTVFLTHLHSDHIAGLGELINGSWHSGRVNAIKVYGPAGTQAMMQGWKAVYQRDILFRSEGSGGILKPELAIAASQEVKATEVAKRIYHNDEMSVSVFEVDHEPVYPAFGYVLQYKNCKIVISGDTRVDAALAKNSENADLLISEAVSETLYSGILAELKVAKASETIIKFANQIYNYHANSYTLSKMAASSKVKRLVLTHLLPSIPTDDESLRNFKGDMSRYYQGPMTVANDRDEITVSSDGKGPCEVNYERAKPGPVPVIKVR